jgi:hypothetical protein
MDTNGLVRPASMFTTGVKQLYGQSDQNYYSGPFQYDGFSNLERTGSTLLVPSQADATASGPSSSFGSTTCQGALYDSLGDIYASAPDSSCAYQLFYFYNARDVVVRTEDRLVQDDLRTWRFFDRRDNFVTEYKQKNTTGAWLSTVDTIYSDDRTLATEEITPGGSPVIRHYHPAPGSGGILTDANGYRTN